MSARVLSLGLLLPGLLLAAPARAQEPPPAPAPEAPPPSPPQVVVVTPPEPAPAPPPGAAPYAPYPYPYPAYAPYPTLTAPPPPRKPGSVFSGKLWAGPGYRRIYDVNLYTGDLGIALGAQRGSSAWYGVMEGMAGRTDRGLKAYEYWLGASWEGVIDRVRLGLGVHFGYLGILRATTGGTMGGLGLGVFGFVTVDLVQSEEGHAFYLGARMTGNYMDGNVGVAAPSATLGLRY